MKKKIFLKIILTLSLIIIVWFVYLEYFKKEKSSLSKPVNPSTEIEEDTKEEVRTEIEKDSRAFFEIYTPVNILKEVKYRITGK